MLAQTEISELSHKLRTPLSCIVGLVDIFEKNNLTPLQLEFMKDIEQCTHEVLGEVDALIKKLREPTPVKKALKILLVEDDLMLQKLTSTMLKKSGYEVDIADNGKVAVEKFPNGYDIILMDLRMPHMNGFEEATVSLSLKYKFIKKYQSISFWRKMINFYCLISESFVGKGTRAKCPPFSTGHNRIKLATSITNIHQKWKLSFLLKN